MIVIVMLFHCLESIAQRHAMYNTLNADTAVLGPNHTETRR